MAAARTAHAPQLVVVTAHTAYAPDLRRQLVRLVEKPLALQAKLVPFSRYRRAAALAKLPADQLAGDAAAARLGAGLGVQYVLSLVSDRSFDPEQAVDAGARPSLLLARLTDVQHRAVVWEQRYPVTHRLSPAIAARLVGEVGRAMRASYPPSSAGGDLDALALVAAPSVGDSAGAWGSMGAPRVDAPSPARDVVPPVPKTALPPAAAAATPAHASPPPSEVAADQEPEPAAAPGPSVADGAPPPRGPGRRPVAARPSLRLAAAGGAWTRRGNVRAGPDDLPPGYGPPEGKRPPLFVRGQAELDIFPLAIAKLDTTFADLGLQVRANASSVRTRLPDNSIITSQVLGYDGGLVWRWAFANPRGAGVDISLQGGWGTWKFPLAEGPFASQNYAYLYSGGGIGGSLMRELSLTVEGRFLSFVDDRVPGGVLGTSSRYGWGAEARASLRWVLARHLELSLNGYWATFRTQWDGRTNLTGSSLQYSDVRLVDSQAGATLGLGLVLW